MKSWLTILLAVGLFTGCRPSDQKIKTVRQRVLAGEFVTFDNPGFSLCGGNGKAWDAVDLNDYDERSRVIVGKQISWLTPGHSACYRVGDVIKMGVYKKSSNGGLVRIDRIGLVLLDGLSGRNSEKLRGRFFASEDNLSKAVESVRKRVKATDEGIITVVDMSYVGGTAVDENAVREKDAQDDQSDAYEETTRDGQSISPAACGTETWSEVRLNPDFKDAALNGTIKSWYQFGTKNCLKQGQTGSLKAGADAVAQIRVTKIKRFRVRGAVPGYFQNPDLDFEIIRRHIQTENTKHADFMTVMDFELVPAGGK